MLNLSPYLSGMNDKYPIYRLYAVVVHLGVMNAAHSGHYVSYIKDFQGAWFRIDDSRVCYCTDLRISYLSFHFNLGLIADKIKTLSQIII